MKKIVLFSVMLMLAFCSCHKDRKNNPGKPEPLVTDTIKQYSYWTINDDSFKSNNVEPYIGMATSRLECRDNINRYRIGFTLNYLPTSGQFEINYIEDPTNVGMDFYYNDAFYIISPNQIGFLSASLGKAKISQVRVLDISGKVWRRSAGNSSRLTLSLKGLAGGIYLMQVKTDKGLSARTFVVRH